MDKIKENKNVKLEIQSKITIKNSIKSNYMQSVSISIFEMYHFMNQTSFFYLLSKYSSMKLFS